MRQLFILASIYEHPITKKTYPNVSQLASNAAQIFTRV